MAFNLAGSPATLAFFKALQCVTNGYHSFCVLPDGSKEGWDESDAKDEARAALIKYLRLSARLEFVELRFGHDDEDEGAIENSSWPELDLDD